jgi:hypothetical protein
MGNRASTANISSAVSRGFRGKCKFVLPEWRGCKCNVQFPNVSAHSGFILSLSLGSRAREMPSNWDHGSYEMLLTRAGALGCGVSMWMWETFARTRVPERNACSSWMRFAPLAVRFRVGDANLCYLAGAGGMDASAAGFGAGRKAK